MAWDAARQAECGEGRDGQQGGKQNRIVVAVQMLRRAAAWRTSPCLDRGVGAGRQCGQQGHRVHRAQHRPQLLIKPVLKCVDGGVEDAPHTPAPPSRGAGSRMPFHRCMGKGGGWSERVQGSWPD